jgi:hypothetical protein
VRGLTRRGPHQSATSSPSPDRQVAAIVSNDRLLKRCRRRGCPSLVKRCKTSGTRPVRAAADSGRRLVDPQKARRAPSGGSRRARISFVYGCRDTVNRPARDTSIGAERWPPRRSPPQLRYAPQPRSPTRSTRGVSIARSPPIHKFDITRPRPRPRSRGCRASAGAHHQHRIWVADCL